VTADSSVARPARRSSPLRSMLECLQQRYGRRRSGLVDYQL
jgi:hypothetical protein